MKKNTKIRLLCGFAAAVLATVTVVSPVKVSAAPSPEDIQKQIAQNVQEAIDYQIEQQEKEQVTPQPQWPYPYDPYWWEHHHKDPYWWFYGPWSMELEVGSTQSINLHGRGGFQSTNGGIASVDYYGNVTGIHEGHCDIIVTSYDGGGVAYVHVHVKGERKNDKKDENKTVVYVQQPVYNAVNANASWLAIATNLVVATPRNGTVNLSSLTPLNFDANFANVLKLRPDVTVNVTYGFNGHTFLLTIPRGYNLTSRLNAAGYVDFVTLSNVVDGKINCRLLY